MIWNEIARGENIPTEEQQYAIVEEELRELQDAIKDVNFVEELDAIADIFYTNAYMFHLYPKNPICEEAKRAVLASIDCYGEEIVVSVIKEVIASNYTKFMPKSSYSKVQAVEERDKLECKHKCWVTVMETEEYFIFLNENNKVLKPSSYIAPKIREIVYKNNNN